MNLEELSAVQLGSLVNSRRISPVEVIQYFKDRVEKRNPSINALVYTKFDEAITVAEHMEEQLSKGVKVGPLAGVPVALKDFLPSKKGWTASHGGVRSFITVDEYDSEFCKACESLGAIVIGKTNAPSFGFSGACDNPMYGPTSTPWKEGYNSGGSSGGSAAAVADGLVAVAEGGDAGGSIRIPSAWCGCFGFKPSAGLVPSVCRPDAWAATHPYCCGGPISRTVEDACVILDQMMKYDPRDPLSVPLKVRLNQYRKLPLTGFKVGVTHNFDLFPNPDPALLKPFDDVIKALELYGAHVEDVHFKFDYSLREIESAWLQGISVDTALDFELEKLDGVDRIQEHPEDYQTEFIYWKNRAITASMLDYRKFHDIRTNILDAHLDVFEKYDIIISPISACKPVANAQEGITHGPGIINGASIDPAIGFAYTYLENMIGTPAASVPVGVTPDGFPIGLQVIGSRYRDLFVMQVADKLETEMPWSYSIPYSRSVDNTNFAEMF